MSELLQFLSRFSFDPRRNLHVGVERECFIVRKGRIVAEAPRVLAHIHERGWEPPAHTPASPFDVRKLVGYELSACQIETRTRPLPLELVEAELLWQERELRTSLTNLGLSPLYREVAPVSMPLDVYPDPSGRYAALVQTMPSHVLRAACRVIGTHVHIGMPDHATALKVHDAVIKECDSLCRLGDSSFGERLALYRIVAPHADPKPYGTLQNFFKTAVEKGFSEDPRTCWTLIRISAHGTIEFRMFGATASVERIMDWVRICSDLCRAAL